MSSDQWELYDQVQRQSAMIEDLRKRLSAVEQHCDDLDDRCRSLVSRLEVLEGDGLIIDGDAPDA